MSYYGAIAGLQELGPEVIKVFVLPHIKAISARIDAATESVSVMGGGTNMEKIAALHIRNLILKGCSPVLKTLKQLPDISEEYKSEYGSIGTDLYKSITRSRSSGTSSSVPSVVSSAQITPTASLPTSNVTAISKTGPTLVRLTSTPASSVISPTSTMPIPISTEQIALSGQVQTTVSTVIATNSTTGTISNAGALANNAQQKIIVMSPSPMGQIQVVPQLPRPPTPQ